MKKLRMVLLMLLVGALIAFAIGCGGDGKQNGKPDNPPPNVDNPGGNEPDDPAKKLNIGVMFGDDVVQDGMLTIDYKNALAGIAFFDKDSVEQEYITKALTQITVNGTAVDSQNYVYDAGLLEFEPDYFLSLTLGTEYAVKAVFGTDEAEFKMTLTDSLTPAYTYADTLIKEVYLTGVEVSLPTATKSPASIQNTRVEYSLVNSEGTAMQITNNKFVATDAERYTYTATFYKNNAVEETKTRSFSVIDLETANLASEHVVAVLGGAYDETEQASRFTGKHTLSLIELDSAYKFVRIEYKGSGSVTFDKKDGDNIVPDTAELESAEYKTVWLTTSYINSVEIESAENLFIKSFTVSQSSAFNAYDIENVNFAGKDLLPYWQYGGNFVPSFNEEKNALILPKNGNSYVYALRQRVIKEAYDNGFKYLVIGYKGAGTTRVFNDTTGDWGGFSKDLPASDTNRRLSFNLDVAANSAAIDFTSGFSFIVNDTDIELYEFKFYTKDVVAIEAGVYNDANIADEGMESVWSEGAAYDTQASAMAFAAGKTYTFGEEALDKAQHKGAKKALSFIAKGKGKVQIFAADSAAASVEVTVDSLDYVAKLMLFGSFVFTQESYIAVVPDAGSGLTVRSMWFTDNTSEEITNHLAVNLASESFVAKWENWGNENTSFDSVENALKFTGNGGSAIPHLTTAAVLEASRAGFDAVKFVAKGRFALYMFNSEWDRLGSLDALNIYDNYSTDEYVTGLIVFAGITDKFSANTNLGMWTGTGDSYIKSMEFVRKKDLVAEAPENVRNIFQNEANIAAEAFKDLWKTTDKASVDYTDGSLKITFDGKNSFAFELKDWQLYAILFGKTKFVWTYDAENSNANDIRIKYTHNYSDGNPTVKSINGQGDKVTVDGQETRVTECALAFSGVPQRICIESNATGSQTYTLTDFHFE